MPRILEDILNRHNLTFEGNLFIDGNSMPLCLDVKINPCSETTDDKSIDDKLTQNKAHSLKQGKKRMGYRAMAHVMREKYSHMHDVCTMVDVLSGNYFNEKRVWYWKDRMTTFLEQIDSCGIPDLALDEIIKLLKNNLYLRRAHPEIFERLCSHLRKRQSCTYDEKGMVFGGENMEIARYSKKKGKFDKRAKVNRRKMIDKIKRILRKRG